MGFTSSVSGFHYPIESNQKLLQAPRSHVASMNFPPSPMELGQFSGYNAAGWVLQAELYFDFYAISDAHKLHYVSSYFVGDALEWFHWMCRNNQLVDWKYFKEQVVLRFQSRAIIAPLGCLVEPSQARFGYDRSATMVPPVTQVFSSADSHIIPTYFAFESASQAGNSNAEQVFDEMPLAEASPFSSDNEVLMSIEGYAVTTKAHLLDECSQQTNHKVFLYEQSDATTFSSEGHSDREDEISEEVCDVQAKFEGSMSAVQKTLVANDEFALEDFAPIFGNIQLHVHVSTTGSLSKCASDSISHSSCLFTNFNSSAPSYVTGRHNKFELPGEKLPLGQVLDTCCHTRTCSYLHFKLEPILDILPFGSVMDAWVDTGQLSDSLSYVAATPHRFYNKLGRYPYAWNWSSDQLFDNLFQTCECSKVFTDNPPGDAIGMRCQFDFVRSTTGNSIISSYFIPSMFEGVTLMLDGSLQWCLSFNAFHAISTMKFGENQVAPIADKSPVFTLEFEEAFNLTFSMFRTYDRSALAYHCIPKSKDMTFILHVSDAHDNAFTELLAVEYAKVHVDFDRNFVLRVSHKTPEFFQLNAIGQVPLLETLDSHVGENKAIACFVTLWHHQSIPTCFQVEMRNTLAYLAENIGHYMHRNCSDNFEYLSDLNLENLWDTAVNQMCSILDDPVWRVQLAPASPLLLLNNTQCISLVRAVCSFLREELKFPTQLVVQVRGSHIAKVESTKRVSKYNTLMKLVTVFEELVRIWCNNLQVTWFGSCSLVLVLHAMSIGVYVQHGWLNHKRRFFSVLISHDIVAALARALIVRDFTVHTCENDSWTQSMIESELPLFSSEAKLVLPCMLPLDLARHSLEFGTRLNEESFAFMLSSVRNKSSSFPTAGFDFFLIIITPITLGFLNRVTSSSTFWITWLRFQDVECSFYAMNYDLADPAARMECEFWANIDVECRSKCENQGAFVKNFKGASPALEQNQLTTYSIMWYFPGAFLLHAQSKSASVLACQDTFWGSICEFSILLELIFVGESYTQCETSGALHYGLNFGVCWKGLTDGRTYSACIDDNKKGCDCSPLEMGSACLVIQDVNVVVLHNLAALEANLFNWLVDQMHRDIVLAIEASGQDFVWDANMDRDAHDTNMIFVLLYSNLEDKVLLEGESNVTKLATMEDPIDIMSNDIWDPG